MSNDASFLLSFCDLFLAFLGRSGAFPNEMSISQCYWYISAWLYG